MNEKPQGERWCSLPHDPWCLQCKRELARLRRIEEAARESAALVDGLEGLTAQRMHMTGTSPVKLLGQMRDLIRSALAEQEPTE